jgi:transcriptional antiterminator RfaH
MTSNSNSNVKHWFALYTKPRQEFKAADQLNANSIEHYLPTLTQIKKWSDRKKKVTEPIFRGYIFIQANEKERLLSLTQSAIVRCISFEGKPSVIPDWQVESLKSLLTTSPEVFVHKKIAIGTKVKIADGPFAGVIGVVTGQQEDKWLAVSVDLINCSVMVRLPQESGFKILDN